MFVSPPSSTPPTPFGVAGPNKRTIAEGIWNAGTVNAVKASQLQVQNNTLEFISGPTIAIANTNTQATNDPLIVTGNTAVPSLNDGCIAAFIGADGIIQPSLYYIGWGGVTGPVIHWIAAGGTEANPTATPNGLLLGNFGFGGYDGSAYATDKAGFGVQAIENWTTAANGTQLTFSVCPTGSTSNPTSMVLTNGSSATPLPFLSLGSSSASPGLLSGAGVPTASRPKGSVYMRTDGSIGANVYISNGGGTWTAIALV